MESNFSSPLLYKGNVNIKLLINGEIVSIKKSNNGLDELFRIICKSLAGYSLSNSELPAYVDLRKSTVNGYSSVLNKKITISALKYRQSKNNGSEDFYWNTVATSVILPSNVNFSDIGKDDNVFRLYLLNNSTDLAFIEFDQSFINYMNAGAQMLVDWELIPVNATANNGGV